MPLCLIGVGAVGSLLGLTFDARQFAFSWLLAFVILLSLCLGALFLVIVHHLFDAAWSVPIRRVCEHIACLLFPWMAILFLPLTLLAPSIYPWIGSGGGQVGYADHSTQPLLTRPIWCAVAAGLFGVWWWLSRGLRRWSLTQDATGAAECTHRLRRYSAGGAFLFAITVTLAAVMWIKSIDHEWFSTIYGVYFFAGSVWFTLAVLWFMAMLLKRAGIIGAALGRRQFHSLGVLMLAFTVFYAYIHFSQYFVIWNANLPYETSWYVVRERGSWRHIGLLIVFGHFLVPFLILLRADIKLSFKIMAPLCVWIWLMHYVDIAFNILPTLSPEGFPLRWVWLHMACHALMIGVLAQAFLRDLRLHPPYPIRDPRLSEALEIECHGSSADNGCGENTPRVTGDPRHGTNGGAT